MKIFELHFNQITKEHLLKKGELVNSIFDSFCYEPQNIYEKRLGYLFLAGELKNPLPKNFNFLEKLANFLKKEYYTSPIKLSTEAAFKESLKKINNYLEGIVKEGDVSWLGNLNSAVLSFKNFDLNFSKIGSIKILLLRQGQLMDIGKNLELEEIEPYPLKVFGKIVSGRLAENDIVLVLTKEAFDFFQNKNLFKKLTQIFPFNQKDLNKIAEKKLKEFLKSNEKDFSKIFGFCLICLLTKEEAFKEKSKSFAFRKKPERFSFKKAFLPFFVSLKKISFSFFKILINILLKIKEILQKIIKKLLKFSPPIRKKSEKKEKRVIKVPVKEKGSRKEIMSLIKIKQKLLLPKIVFNEQFKKNLVLISLFVFLLLLGFFIFKKQQQEELKETQLIINGIKKEISSLENLPLEDENRSFEILKNAREKILPLVDEKSNVQKEAKELKDLIEGKLKQLTKFEEIVNPELFFEINKNEFASQKIIVSGKNLYLFNQFSENILKINEKKEKNILTINQKFNDAIVFNDYLLFFKKPNHVFFLKNDQLEKDIFLDQPFADFDFKNASFFQSSIYFLDKSGEIIKYSNFSNPKKWLSPQTKKNTDAKFLTVDGNIWLLNNDNSISRYFGGELKETINLNLFPSPKNFKKILAIGGYLYILEPAEKRIIIINENSKLIKQIFSEKFDNLLDFTVSENGKTIWLLNNNTIYQISY